MIRTLSKLATLVSAFAAVNSLGCSEGASPAPTGAQQPSTTGQPTGSQAAGDSAGGAGMGPVAGMAASVAGAEARGATGSGAGTSASAPEQGGATASGGTGPDMGGMTSAAGAGAADSSGDAMAGVGGASDAGSAGMAAGGEDASSAGAGMAGAGGAPQTQTIMSPFGDVTMQGAGTSDMQYETALVSRNEVPYVLITNGWGPGFEEHTVSWSGTSFIVESMNGTRGPGGEPASYPTVFCGRYSVRQVPDCGLPAPIAEIQSLKTGWAWSPNDNAGEYNAAYDIWVGDGTRLQGYLMVWLRDPPMNQPAGSPNMAYQGITVENVPGTWNIWDGTVNGLPIINWVRPEGEDTYEIEFDVMDFLRDADMRGLSYPGTHINVVAVGFEIWEGPITNLQTVDFYVDVQ